MKMKKLNLKSVLGCLMLLSIIVGIFTSCKKDDFESTRKAPTIIFEQPDGIYKVKVGRTITIEPTIENDEDAFYTWITSEGQLIGRDKKLTYSWDKNGQVYITFEVNTDYGSSDKEIRVDVAELIPPTISLIVPKGGYTVLQEQELILAPLVDNEDQATFEWKMDGVPVASTKDYTFKSNETGKFHMSLATKNEDGEDFIEFDVNVKSPSGMPFSWLFESEIYNVAKGRTIRLLPYSILNAFDAEYIWVIDGVEVQRSKNPLYAFAATTEGEHTAEITMTNKYSTIKKQLTIHVCPAEGTYKRAVTSGSKTDWDKVYEFLAAPGQFVNENYTATTMEAACSYAEKQLAQNAYVSLGGFGGYVVIGFDHSIENDGGYNFQIIGNSFKGSSEPGIVYVMQDENGDGLPNDTWYELKGSEYGKPETIQDYEVTYYKPRAAGMPVSWTDNQGKTGSVDYLVAYHRQDFYYPNWVKTSSYTLRGTCLKSRTREVSPGYWSNDSFEWGYADNFSAIDRLTGDDNHNAGANANHFKISDAVTFDGKPANLQYIDFIKVQTGVNAKAGWLGENSTEVFGARDYNMIKNK